MRPEGPRDAVAGPDSGPEPPFPIKLSGPVITGFGRGSKEVRKNFSLLSKVDLCAFLNTTVLLFASYLRYTTGIMAFPPCS
jgi:hypothetical protein